MFTVKVSGWSTSSTGLYTVALSCE
jgi:hypothetical protein